MVAALAEREHGVTVYDRRGRKKTTHSYREVHVRARAWGAWFKAQGVSPGEIVFLCLPTSHDLVEAFLGAVLLGALPCNLALPRAVGGLEVFKRRLQRLAEPFPGAHLVASEEVGMQTGRTFFVAPSDLDVDQQVELTPVDPGALAYVQLTSGSTTTPKAVSISHSNLAANVRAIMKAGGEDTQEAFVSWLPLYHDMGLVGMAMVALFHGNPLVLMRPETFVGTPLKWLQAIAAEGVASTTAPNFAYQWCVDRIREEKLEGLDLSGWRIACCGAEVVRPETLKGFVERFTPYGLKANVFVPCYGMAETTLGVSFCPGGRAIRIHDGRVSCGPPLGGTRIEIRSPKTGEELPAGEEGEIVIFGPSNFQGYYGNPEATARVLKDGAYASGDLGYLHDGELYVTGRLKDLIILDGVNVAPYELEWIADTHLVVAGGRAAAFSIEIGSREVPVLAAEVRDVPDEAAIEATKTQIAEDIAPLYDLVLVRRGSLPKTSSGKVQRGKIKASYLAGSLDTLWRMRESS
jgi:fatty-acyl-CoA synthase